MIKKQADLDFFEGTAPAAGAPASPSTAPSGGGGSRTNPEVLKMQSAAEAFANKVKSGNIPVNIQRDLIEGVERVSGQAKFTDGAWGPITDQALHSIANLAAPLTLLSERFGLDNIYPKQNVDLFNKILGMYQIEGQHISLTQEEQSKWAPVLVQHIEKISELYSSLLGKVKTTSNEGILNTNEKQLIQSGRVVITHSGKPLEVPLSALTSLNNYAQFCSENNLNDKDRTEVLDLIINTSRAT